MDMKPLLAKMDRVLPYLNKTRDVVLKEECVSIVKKTINLSPPGSQGQTTSSTKDTFVKGIAAKRQGENAILKDLMGGRRGNGGGKSNARFGIFEVMDDKLLSKVRPHQTTVRLFVKKDGTVYGCDTRFFKPNATIEDMETHHRQYFRNGRMTAAGGNTRDIGRWKFIDKMVVSKSAFNRFLKHQQKKVGLYASSMLAALGELGGSGVPAWISRHKGKLGGGASMNGTGDLMTVKITASPPFSGDALQRRMDAVLKYSVANMPKRVKHITRAALKKAGLTASSLT